MTTDHPTTTPLIDPDLFTPPPDLTSGAVTRSTSIAQLALALSKAQSMMTAAARNAQNPHFGSDFADLSAVWAAIRLPLAENRLAVMQLPSTTDEGRVVVHTILAHESGEFVACDFTVRPVKTDPQGIGSALTYARRYALSAVVGVAPADDDGNAASEPGPKAATRRRAAPAPPSEPPHPATAADVPESARADSRQGDTRMISEAQCKRMFAIAKAAGRDYADVKAYLKATYGISADHELRRKDYEDACAWISETDTI